MLFLLLGHWSLEFIWSLEFGDWNFTYHQRQSAMIKVIKKTKIRFM